MKKVRNLSKMPTRKVTIDDVLFRDDIDSVLSDINEDKEDFEELLVIALNKDDEVMWRHSGLKLSRIIYLMELVKNCLLNEK